MKVFISGPMSGKPNFNREAFFKAQEELEKLGYSVWNPAWLAYPSDTEFSDDDMHDIDIEALKHCDVIYMLKGWQDSKGARIEHEIAKKRGLLTMYEDPSYFGTLYKQRDKINDVNQAINDVEADLDNFKDETDGKMNDIYDTLHRHSENLDTCQNDMHNLGRICNNRYADNVNKIYRLRKEVEAIKESIGTDNLKEQLEKDFADVYTEFQNTKDKVNDIEFGYIDWSSKMSSAIDEMEKVKDTVKSFNSLVTTLGEQNEVLSDDIYELQRIIVNSDIENISIKAMNQKLIDLGRELDVLSTIDTRIDVVNNRLKAIEKRLSIKPFYAPTEDEKDDD